MTFQFADRGKAESRSVRPAQKPARPRYGDTVSEGRFEPGLQDGRGQPLDVETRNRMEPLFGRDFSGVRVHTAAPTPLAAADAPAYTIGRDIYFTAGRYAPRTPEGGRLLAHELAHVAQQTQPGNASMSSPTSVAEHEARAAADTVAAGRPFAVQSGTRVSVACAPPKPASQTPAPQPGHLAPPLPLEEAAAAPIRPADRHTIELGAAVEIATAYTNFTGALDDHVAAINAEAKAKAEMVAAVIDVLTGFAAPIFATWAVGKLAALANQAPSEYSKQLLLGLIKKEDALKAAFTAATKTTSTVIKAEAQPLFGETEIKLFSLLLKGAFHAGIVHLGNRLGSMSDTELLAVWAAYSDAYATPQAYRQALKPLFEHYQEQVEPIGKESLPDELGQSVRSDLYEVQLATRKRLATISVWTRSGPSLWAWITPDMEAVARAKAAKLGLGIPTIALKDVQVSLFEILDPPRPDLRRKDMLEVVQALSLADRQRAAADPDVITVVETMAETSGRVPNQYERHKTLFLLRGFSSQAIACLDELDSLFPNWTVINQHLQATTAAERTRLAQDQWFIGRLRAELGGHGLTAELGDYQLGQVLFTLGLKPKPPPEPKPYYPLSPRWR
ncbi:DUF4157 domain-containing protein [Streptomyces sp. NPDC005708]|uniref:eCIS core domain-containing protein n=1 Tax=Streptomyces sp. NPDC005708 TaxID=3154564 RepID=UPI00340A5194